MTHSFKVKHSQQLWINHCFPACDFGFPIQVHSQISPAQMYISGDNFKCNPHSYCISDTCSYQYKCDVAVERQLSIFVKIILIQFSVWCPHLCPCISDCSNFSFLRNTAVMFPLLSLTYDEPSLCYKVLLIF